MSIVDTMSQSPAIDDIECFFWWGCCVSVVKTETKKECDIHPAIQAEVEHVSWVVYKGRPGLSLMGFTCGLQKEIYLSDLREHLSMTTSFLIPSFRIFCAMCYM